MHTHDKVHKNLLTPPPEEDPFGTDEERITGWPRFAPTCTSAILSEITDLCDPQVFEQNLQGITKNVEGEFQFFDLNRTQKKG
jgi:hypothetical protein